MTQPNDRDARTASGLALGGAALAAFSTMLPWVEYGFGISSVGLSYDFGMLALLVALVAAGVALWVRYGDVAPDGAWQLLVVCGVAVAALAAFAPVHVLMADRSNVTSPTGLRAGVALAFAGAALLGVGGWLVSAAPRFGGCRHCAERVRPDDLAQHLVRRHGVPPAVAVDEAARV